MTQRTRVSSLSPETSTFSVAETPKRKHRRKIPPHNTTATHESNYENTEDEDEQPTNNTATYTESESLTNIPRNRFSSPESESEVESQSISETSISEPATSVNSISNSPNLLQPTNATAYINIAPLPIFRGGPDECPITHLSRFAKVCRANNASSMDMMMRIFPVTLENEAAIWYDLNIEPCPSLTWEKIKCSFMQAYRRIEFVDQFRSELMVMKQGDNESVHAFFLRLQWILKRWPDHGIPDGLLKGIFVDGLREDFQDWIDPQKPSSLNEALRLALTWEQAKSIRAARNKKNVTGSLVGSSVKCGFCDGSHEERTCEIRERMRDLWMKNKEKELPEMGDGVKKDFVRSGSVVTSGCLGREGEEEEKDEGGLVGWKKKSQCQCWKHQCWKKKMERNNSLVSRISKAD